MNNSKMITEGITDFIVLSIIFVLVYEQDPIETVILYFFLYFIIGSIFNAILYGKK